MSKRAHAAQFLAMRISDRKSQERWQSGLFGKRVQEIRALGVIGGQTRQFEEFIAWVAAGARWKVLSGAAFIAVTGLGLLLLPSAGKISLGQWACVVAKVILFVVAVSLFCFTSWAMWPARILASAEEIPKFQQRFRIIAVVLLALVGASIVLGVLSSHL